VTRSLWWQTLSKYYAEVTPMTGMRLNWAHILNRFQKLRLFRKWDKVIDINSQGETSYTIKYKEAFLNWMENEYCAKHRYLPVIELEQVLSKNLFPSAKACGCSESPFETYYSSSDNAEYPLPEDVTEMTPARSDCIAYLLPIAWLCLNSHPDSPMN